MLTSFVVVVMITTSFVVVMIYLDHRIDPGEYATVIKFFLSIEWIY